MFVKNPSKPQRRKLAGVMVLLSVRSCENPLLYAATSAAKEGHAAKPLVRGGDRLVLILGELRPTTDGGSFLQQIQRVVFGVGCKPSLRLPPNLLFLSFQMLGLQCASKSP